MEDKNKKIIIISVAITAMAVFVYLEFIQPGKLNTGVRTDAYVNPSELDQSPSKQEVYAEKRKKEREAFSFDRKVNSLEHFLNNQVEKSPFPEIDTLKEIEFPSPAENLIDSKVLIVEENGRERSLRVSAPVGKQEKVQLEKKRRRIGFATGGAFDQMEVQSDNHDRANKINVLSVVQNDVRITTGSALKLRTLQSFSANSIVVPENTFVVGHAKFTGDRIIIKVESIPVNGNIIPVNLTAYDLHGNEGIYVEGGLESEIQEDALEQTVSELQRNVKVPILRNVPFNSARKKIREPEIPIPSGYKVYLRSQ